MLLTAPTTMAQELGSADRLAVLYSTQLRFDASGEPLIRIGIVEDEQRVTLQVGSPILIQPMGDSGPETQLPPGRYQVSITDGRPGSYTHYVVIDELSPSDREGVRASLSRWGDGDYPAGMLNLGATFSVRGSAFDTRKVLIVKGPFPDRESAVELRDSLIAEHGIDAKLHSELDEYPSGLITFESEGGSLKVRHNDLLWARTVDGSPVTIHQVAYDRGTRFEGREDRQYAGRLLFTPDRDGRLSVVNEASAELLLRGIVPAEIFIDAPPQALRAQAIAARTELLADLGVRHLAEPWMTCADQRCQVYRGLAYERSRTNSAVEDTRGELLVYEGQIINAFYSSNNGGFSANNGPTWGGTPRPYLPARFDGPQTPAEYAGGLSDEANVVRFLSETPDAYSNITSFSSGRSFRWQTRLEGEELARAVAARYPQIGRLRDLEVLSRDDSGRVTRLRLVGTNSEAVVERELNVRRTFGGLRSALMVFEVERDSAGLINAISFRGAGFGHGVGMCQTGAIGAAERGRSYRDILSNYYPGTELRSLY